jgi:hypothetical protein
MKIKHLNSLRTGIFALLSICIVSCKNSGSLLPNATGSAFDVLVAGNPTIWKSPAGKALFDVLNEDMPGLPQSEPMFNISFIPEKNFDGILRPVRNIILFEINDKIYTQGRISYARNTWATSQVVIKITAPNQEEFIKVVNEKRGELISFLEKEELERLRNYFTRYSNREGAKIVYDQFGTDVIIPSSLDKSKTGKDFAWFSNGSYDLRQDIIVYSYPYRGEEDFRLENLLQKRDSVLQKHIEGPSPGSYMTTERHFEITHKEIQENGKYRALLRGLWRVEGDLMGGPFVSVSYLDEKRNRIITIEGFIYGPSHKKRNHIRQLESVIHALKIPE